MGSNNLSAFMNSISETNPYITCPACGNNMALRDFSSYKMILTDNARDEINQYIRKFRNVLLATEVELGRINRFGIERFPIKEEEYPHHREISETYRHLMPDGTYAKTVTAMAAKELMNHLDVLEFTRLFHEKEWPTHSFSPKSKLKGQNATVSTVTAPNGNLNSSPVVSVLIRGMDKASISGPLVDLIFDQENVIDWLIRATTNNGTEISADLKEILRDVCPNYAIYLEDLLQEIGANTASEHVDTVQQIIRAQLILVLLLGHASAKATPHLQGPILGNAPYELPRKTFIIDYQRLEKLLTSHIVIKSSLGWDAKLIESLKELAQQERLRGRDDATAVRALDPTRQRPTGRPEDAARPESRAGTKLDDVLRQDLKKLVRFVCSGPAAKLYHSDHRKDDLTATVDLPTKGKNGASSSAVCGWYPKEDDTYPIVLLGSPGSGKSTIMRTGLLAFIESISALGATVSFDRPEDIEYIRQEGEKYWQGDLPGPTPSGSRQSVHLRVTQTIEGNRKFGNFIFTDIPGETLAASLGEQGSSSSLLGVLSAAETIVFLFDLLIEDSIRLALANQKEEITEIDSKEEPRPLENGENKWVRLTEAYSKIKLDRQTFKGTKVELSQAGLLNQVIQDLKMKHGVKDNETITKLNVICVMPKIDLYADVDNSNDHHMFFNDFFQMLAENRYIFPSSYNYGRDFSGLRSAAGVGHKDMSIKAASREEKIIEICERISTTAVDCLTNITKAFYHYQPTDYPEAVRLQEMLEYSLIRKLRTSFEDGRIFFLPVCAQGIGDQKVEDTADDSPTYQTSLGKPPNQKLAEFVFMLPVALSLKTTDRV